MIKWFIRKNTPELRKKLEELGYRVCVCCTFENNIWLNVFEHEDRKEIHGVGCFEDYYNTQEEALQAFSEKYSEYDCGDNEELFLEKVKL